MKRPDWDTLFMMKAVITSFRSTCLSRRVGAVIVRNNVEISTGYNGPASGLPHCETCIRQDMGFSSGEGLNYCVAAHAELNAIVMAAKNGCSIENSTLYITTQPCTDCAKYIINSGIKKLVIGSAYPNSKSLEWFKEANIHVKTMDINEIISKIKENLK